MAVHYAGIVESKDKLSTYDFRKDTLSTYDLREKIQIQ